MLSVIAWAKKKIVNSLKKKIEYDKKAESVLIQSLKVVIKSCHV